MRARSLPLLAAVVLVSTPSSAHPPGIQSALEAAAQDAGLPVRLLDALVEHESRWRPGVVGGRDGQCVGLTQICLHTVAACKTDDGYDFEAPKCQEAKHVLLDGAVNLRVAGRRFAAWRAVCKSRTGSARPEHLLSGFGGWDARHRLVCGQRKVNGRWQTVTPQGVQDILNLAKHGGRR